MKKQEFLLMKDGLQKKICGWTIETEQELFSDFVMGCFFDIKENRWKVYINNERGRHRVRLVTISEEEAFEKLLSLIYFEIQSRR